MRHRVPCCMLLFALAGAALAPAALAAEPSAADRETARSLLIDGRAKLAAGDAAGALKAFQGAHAIMRVPTTGLDVAKAQAALGQLIEARTTALDVARMPAASGEPAAFTNARTAAAQLAEQLAGRIPSLEVRVVGVERLPPGVAPRVQVDGAAIPPEATGLPRKVNPGKHEVEVSAPGFTTERRSVTVKEGTTVPVEIRLSPSAAGPESAPAQPGAAGATPPGSPGASAPESDAGGQVPAWAWVAGAGGLVALGIGVGFAVDYASVRSTVDESCPGGVCDPEQYDAAGVEDLLARWDRDVALSVGFGALGLIGVGVAIYGIATAPSAKPSDAARPAAGAVMFNPWLSPSAAGGALRGTF